MGDATSRRWTSSTVCTGRSPIATTRSPACRPARAAGVAGARLPIPTPAGVARIERDVRLDDVVDESPGGAAQRAAEGAHDAGRHRRLEPEGIADRDHELADTEPGRFAEVGGGQRRSVDADDREVGGRIV